MTAGERLRELREKLQLTLREVEDTSSQLAARLQNPEYGIPASRLSDIESKGMLPNLYRLYSMAVIYRTDIRELLRYFGIDVDRFGEDMAGQRPLATHTIPPSFSPEVIKMPTALDLGFDLRKTNNLGRMIEAWGTVPLTFLERLANANYMYGFIGFHDLTMYPLLLPGSFVQIDKSKKIIADEGSWRSEYERPIYFLETRKGYTCSWCSTNENQVMVQPHPLSPVRARVLEMLNEVSVVGQVVGVAMRLQWYSEFERTQSSRGTEAGSQSAIVQAR